MEPKHYTLRITNEELYEKLKYIAKYEDRSISGELWRMIRKRVENFEKEHGEIKIQK